MSVNELNVDSFTLGGYEGGIVVPKAPANGRPWVWRAEFFGAFDYADRVLLDLGWHIVYYKISDKFGSCMAVNLMKYFHDYMVEEFDLNLQADIFGFSRGGLYATNYTAKFPNDISVLYLDAPVLDLKSWPLGVGKGLGSEHDVELCKEEFSTEDIKQINDIPLNKINALNNAKVPIIIVYGDVDDVVPYEENSGVLINKFNYDIKIICKKGVGHHPHSLENPKEIVDFIVAQHRV